MKPFRVLLVDDEESERKKGRELNGNDNIELVVSDSLENAREAALDGFFHLALVDLQLHATDDKNIDGQFFLRELLEGRPSCRRVLFTRTSSKHREALFSLLDPDGAVIDGAVDKTDYQRIWQEWVQVQARRWREPSLKIDGLDDLMGALRHDIQGDEAFGGKSATITCDELEYLVISLFRSKAPQNAGAAGTDVAPFAVDGVKLEPLAGGKSRAAVLLARLATGESAARVACVLKVAPRRESLEESGRYERLVKFRVAPDRRAELLDSATGDTVGGVVYAFAGESPERVRDLNAFFAEESKDAFEILDDLFGAKGDDLWREMEPEPTPRRPVDLGGYFFKEYHLQPDKVGPELIKYASKRAKDLGFEIENGELSSNGMKLSLPAEEFYGGANVRMPYTQAFIHGDLNARNVLVSDDGRVRLIDFRYANFGPIATDFAALEASIRICSAPVPASAASLMASAQEERRLQSEAWSDTSQRPEDVEVPYWAGISSKLVSLARETSPSLRREEYLATCLLYALRVARVSQLAEQHKMRLIVWITTLRAALEP